MKLRSWSWSWSWKVLIASLACSAKSAYSQQSPERPVVSHIGYFSQCQLMKLEVVKNCFQPRGPEKSWRVPPILWCGSSLYSVSVGNVDQSCSPEVVSRKSKYCSIRSSEVFYDASNVAQNLSRIITIGNTMLHIVVDLYIWLLLSLLIFTAWRYA